MALGDAGGHAEKVEAAVPQGKLAGRAAACKCETHVRDAAKKSSMQMCYETIIYEQRYGLFHTRIPEVSPVDVGSDYLDEGRILSIFALDCAARAHI